jgi:hypothetical protein
MSTQTIVYSRSDWEDFLFNLSASVSEGNFFFETGINYYKSFFANSPSFEKINALFLAFKVDCLRINRGADVILRLSADRQKLTLMQLFRLPGVGTDWAIVLTWHDGKLRLSHKLFKPSK